MSKQLAISASASVFAMAAFVLSATPTFDMRMGGGLNQQGATTEVAAPAVDRVIPALFDLLG